MANSYLSHTQTNDASNTKFTFSVWFKRSKLGNQCIYATQAGSEEGRIEFDTNDRLFLYKYNGSSFQWNLYTERKFKDMNAFYHLVLTYDSTQSTASDRLKLYINGTQETVFQSGYANYPSQNANSEYFQAAPALIGVNENTTQYFEGYMSHVAMSHGYAYGPTNFGETDSTTGAWKFKAPTGVTWGSQGYHLKFENAANLGLDSSGNSNNFTKSGNLIQSTDTPSVGLCTLNPNLTIPSGFNITNGNLSFTCSGSQWQGSVSSIAPTKGKWYYECQYTTGSGIKLDITRQKPDMKNMQTNNQSYGAYNDVGYGYQLNNSGTDYYCNNNSCTTWDSSANGNSTKIYMVCIDLDNGKYWIGANGTWANKTGTANPATGTDPLHSFSAAVNGEPFFITLSAEGTGSTHHANFGNGYYGTTAVSTNSGNGYSDANSEGKFSYQPPSGFYALTTRNYNTYG
jgi:hypothetical protein